MDVIQARTFLTIVSTGSFIEAAGRLNVTQSTVSARIKALEQFVGARLFVRNKGGTTLTHAGRKFQKHASLIVRAAEQARQDVGTPEDYCGILRIGGQAGLWNRLLHNWLPWMRCNAPEVAIRAQLGTPIDMTDQLVVGALDIGVMYTPRGRPGLEINVMLEDRLVLCATETRYADVRSSAYVFVDWGREFRTAHSVRFPDYSGAAITVGLGTLGFQHVLECGGSGFFPERLAWPYLQSGRLFVVEDAPVFTLPVYVVHARDADPKLLTPALHGLRAVGQQEWRKKRPVAKTGTVHSGLDV